MSGVVVHPPAQLAVQSAWLKHLTDTTLSMRVVVQSLDTLVQPVNQATNYVLSRARPVVVTDGARKSRTGNLTVLLQSQAELKAWVALTKDSSVLQFTSPPAWGWEFASAYMSLGAISLTNPAGIGRNPNRLASAPFVLVDGPG